MGKMKEHPKYNVLSVRVADQTKTRLVTSLGIRSMQQFIHDAITEKLKRESVMIAPDRYGC